MNIKILGALCFLSASLSAEPPSMEMFFPWKGPVVENADSLKKVKPEVSDKALRELDEILQPKVVLHDSIPIDEIAENLMPGGLLGSAIKGFDVDGANIRIHGKGFRTLYRF